MNVDLGSLYMRDNRRDEVSRVYGTVKIIDIVVVNEGVGLIFLE